eukprot:9483850-Pyramimonas_sp.AAC.1
MYPNPFEPVLLQNGKETDEEKEDTGSDTNTEDDEATEDERETKLVDAPAFVHDGASGQGTLLETGVSRSDDAQKCVSDAST